jgi:hypothetical protein
LQAYTHRALERMGVEIHTNSLAIAMDHESITFKSPEGEQTIRARTRIWAAGVAASPLAKQLAGKAGVETDRAGRIPVNPDCTLPGHPEVFAIGDMVSLNKLPGVAQPALQEGKYVGKVIKQRLAGETDVAPFQYFDKGSMATIGHRSAVADAFKMKVTGVIATGWAFIHVLPGRLGQPAAHPVPVAAEPGVHQEPQPPDHHLLSGEEGPRHGRLPTGRLAAILPAARRPEDLSRPLAVPTRPSPPPRNSAGGALGARRGSREQGGPGSSSTHTVRRNRHARTTARPGPRAGDVGATGVSVSDHFFTSGGRPIPQVANARSALRSPPSPDCPTGSPCRPWS